MSNKTLFLLLLILAGILYFRGDDLGENLGKVLVEQKQPLSPKIQEATNVVDITDSIKIFKKDNTKLKYRVFIPDKTSKTRFPVLVCIGGQNSEGNEYHTNPYRAFAKQNGFAIITVAFKNFDNEEFKKKRSYQYPKAWSAGALTTILGITAKRYPINPYKLYLFGFSAGAQFVHRFTMLHSFSVTACAAHGAGGYDLPKHYIKTPILVTVGSEDKSRIRRFYQFVEKAVQEKIKIYPKVISGKGHLLSEEQRQMSFDFFLSIKNGTQVFY